MIWKKIRKKKSTVHQHIGYIHKYGLFAETFACIVHAFVKQAAPEYVQLFSQLLQQQNA